MRVYLVLLIGLLLGGCSGNKVEIIENMRYIYSGDTNPMRPSLTVSTVQECRKEHGYHETTRIDDKIYHCDGRYYTVAIPYAGQNGYLDVAGAVQAGVIGGLGYLAVTEAADSIGDGIAKSGSQTSVTQQGGGAQQSQGQVQGQAQSSYNKNINRNTNSSMSSSGMPMRGGD